MGIFIWVVAIIVYIAVLKYLYRIGRTFLDWRSGKNGSSKAPKALNIPAFIKNVRETTTPSSDWLDRVSDSDEIIAAGPVQIVGMSDDTPEESEESEESEETGEVEGKKEDEEPEENQGTDHNKEGENESSEDDLDLDLTLDSETISSSEPEHLGEEEKYATRRKKTSSSSNRSNQSTEVLELSTMIVGMVHEGEGSGNRSGNFSDQGEETSESFVFNLPGTNHELVTVNKPSDQQIDEFGKMVTTYTDKLVGSMDAMMAPMLDVMETAHPEMKDAIKDMRDLFENEEDDGEEEEDPDKLDNLDDQERIKRILKRADNSKEKAKSSGVRGSQNKLSGDAKVDRVMEKMHGLRRTIIANTAAKQDDPKKKANILALGGMMDNLAETFSKDGIAKVVEQFLGPLPPIESIEAGTTSHRRPTTLLPGTSIGTTQIEEVQDQEKPEEQEEEEKLEEQESQQKQGDPEDQREPKKSGEPNPLLEEL